MKEHCSCESWMKNPCHWNPEIGTASLRNEQVVLVCWYQNCLLVCFMACVFSDSWVGIVGKDIDSVIVMKVDLFP